MKIVFVHSHIFKFDNKNSFFSGGQFPYKIFKERYLKYFDDLTVAARGEDTTSTKNLNLSSGPNVNHVILPNLSKIRGRLKSKKVLLRDLEKLISGVDALVARIPSEHAYEAIKVAKRLEKPYVIEIVGDVYTALWSHGKLMGKILAPISYLKYKKKVKDAPYLIYVTEGQLQRKYPYNSEAVVINASNVDIDQVPKEILDKRINKIMNMNTNSEINIGLIGSYSSKYKGIDTAIKSLKILVERGYNCNLIVLGTGNNLWLNKLAIKLNIEDRVIFAGGLPSGKKVFDWLDNIDIYIQPSLTEGLPRSLIEAMSRGLPCVASSVGGIPELLDGNLIHKAKSVKELSEKVQCLLDSKKSMIDKARLNYTHAKNYSSEVLDARRSEFWKKFIKKELK